MATLAEITANVMVDTDRPDLVAETSLAMNRALRACHYASEWIFDQVTDNLLAPVPPNSTSSWSAAVPARMRQISLITDDAKTFQLQRITPKAYYDPFAILEKTNVYWVLGTQFHFRITDAYASLFVTYLQTPTFADSYIALNHQQYIEFKATQLVLEAIDQGTKANRFRDLAQEYFVELQRQAFSE